MQNIRRTVETLVSAREVMLVRTNLASAFWQHIFYFIFCGLNCVSTKLICDRQKTERAWLKLTSYQDTSLLGYFDPFIIDDLRKSRGLHSVNAYGHGLYMLAGVAQSRHAFVGGTVSMWGR